MISDRFWTGPKHESKGSPTIWTRRSSRSIEKSYVDSFSDPQKIFVLSQNVNVQVDQLHGGSFDSEPADVASKHHFRFRVFQNALGTIENIDHEMLIVRVAIGKPIEL